MSSPPTTLGQYQIIREIARSNDIVYEAYDPQMDRRVALKELMLPSGITDAQKLDRVQRFDREAKAAGRLAHPNIMRVFQVDSDGSRHFMAMEFLDGHTLRNEIDTKGFLPVDEAIAIAIEVLKGLGHAHANGVVHRDIKPDNIQILSSGEIKITDFGIARLTFQPNLTMDGQVFGTPSYMSPEQVVGKEIDARSDLFSVGVLLYEMISGQKPFVGDSVVAITYNIMNHEPVTLKQVNHFMWQVIARALDKSPALRFSSAQEMIDALEQASKQSIVLDSPVPPPGQTIYGAPGAYPMPPPVISPYGPPYNPNAAPPPVPPPVVFPYNPYQQGMGGGAPPHTPTYQQGFPQAPIYYPPPPRQPLIKPETRHFIGKMFLTLLVMGTFAAVMIVFIVAIGEAMTKSEAERQDQTNVQKITDEINSKDPASDKIDKIQPLIGQLKSPDNQAQQKRNLAVLWEQVGLDYMAKNDLTDAEGALGKANDLDPSNAKLMSDLAVLYEKSGQADQGPNRVSAYDKSIEWWGKAIDAASPQDKDKYYTAAGEVFYSRGLELANARNFADADRGLSDGIGTIPESLPIHKKLVDLDNQVRGQQ